MLGCVLEPAVFSSCWILSLLSCSHIRYVFIGGFGISVGIAGWFAVVPVLELLVEVSVGSRLPLGGLRLGSTACSEWASSCLVCASARACSACAFSVMLAVASPA